MTEQEWLACEDPVRMLQAALARKPAPGARKLRLFACGVFRAMQASGFDVENEFFRQSRVVETILHVEDAPDQDPPLPPAGGGWASPLQAADLPRGVFSILDVPGVGREFYDNRYYVTKPCQAALLRDIIGNPFRPAALDRSAVPPLVASLAEAAYEHRDMPSGLLETARLAVLSDALEESGRTDTEILAHLRSPGPHVRGCWALDLVLGKA